MTGQAADQVFEKALPRQEAKVWLQAKPVRPMTIAVYRGPKLPRMVKVQGTEGRFHCFSRETVEAAFFGLFGFSAGQTTQLKDTFCQRTESKKFSKNAQFV